MIESRVAELAKIENIPLRQYLTEAEFILLINMPISSVRWFVHLSKVVHGVWLEDGRFLIHRLSAYRAVKRRMRNVINKELKVKNKKEVLSLLGP